MFQIRVKTQQSFLAFVALLTLGVLVVVFTGCGSQQAAKTAPATQPEKHVQAKAAQPEKHVQAKLDIIINQPGMQKDWPAYSPNNLVVPANSLVTVTIRDYDLGNTAMPQNSPFTIVQGTGGRIATADGQNYASMAPDKIAHIHYSTTQSECPTARRWDERQGLQYGDLYLPHRSSWNLYLQML